MVFSGSRFTRHHCGKKQPQNVLIANAPRRAAVHNFAHDADGRVQLLLQLPCQGFFKILAFLDLATRELPLAREVDWSSSTCRQHPPIANDHRTDDHTHCAATEAL